MRQSGLGNTDEPRREVVARPPVFFLRMSSTIYHKNFPGRIHKVGYWDFSYYNYGYLKSKRTQTWARILRNLNEQARTDEAAQRRIETNCKYWQLVLWVHYGDYIHPTRHTKSPTEGGYINEIVKRLQEWSQHFDQ